MTSNDSTPLIWVGKSEQPVRTETQLFCFILKKSGCRSWEEDKMAAYG